MRLCVVSCICQLDDLVNDYMFVFASVALVASQPPTRGARAWTRFARCRQSTSSRTQDRFVNPRVPFCVNLAILVGVTQHTFSVSESDCGGQDGILQGAGAWQAVLILG